MDARVPEWVIDGAPDRDVAPAVLAKLCPPWWTVARVMQDRDVTFGQRALYFLWQVEQVRTMGGFAAVLSSSEPVAMLMSLEVAPALDLRHFAVLLKRAIDVVYPDGLPRNEHEEAAAWETVLWLGDHYEFGDAFDRIDAELPEHEVGSAIARYVRSHPAEFFRDPLPPGDDALDRVHFVDALLQGAPNRIELARAHRLLEVALREAESIGLADVASACRSRLLGLDDRPRPDRPLRPASNRSHVEKSWRAR